MEMVAKEGYDPTEYIRFYNLRNYDRINVSGSMREAEQKSGVDYDEAREQVRLFGATPTSKVLHGELRFFQRSKERPTTSSLSLENVF